MDKEALVNWFGDTTESKLYVITDNKQYPIISKVLESIPNKGIEFVNVDEDDFHGGALRNLDKDDMLIVALSIDSFIYKGFNSIFSPFRKPKNILSKYVFIRLDISEKSLREGLETDFSEYNKMIRQYSGIKENSKVLVTSPSGTNISFKINRFKHCSHYIDEHSDIAFLPASELEAGIELGTANGEIVIDVTVGQINQYGKWLGMFGLVNNPVKLTVKDSKIVKIDGDEDARKLEEILFSLEPEARVLVELGKGLSNMTPTGIIGVDESIANTCHFGIGDGGCVNIDNQASIHLDVVINNPTIKVVD